MAKDVAKLQEGDALKEREKIGQLKPEEKPAPSLTKEAQEREKIVGTIIPKPLPAPASVPQSEPVKTEESLLPRMAKPSSLQKVIVRLLLILLVLGFLLLITFGIWFLVKRKPLTASPTPSPSVSQSASPTASTTQSEVIVPTPLIPIQKTKVVDLAAEAKLKDVLSDTIKSLASTTPSGELVQIAVRKEIAFIGLKTFFTALEMSVPSAVLDNLSDKPEDFTLFLYYQNGQPRFGLLTKVADSNTALQAWKSWENTMEKDWETMFTLVGKTSPAPVTYFRDAEYAQTPFRYQTFSENDLGICYSILNNKLIFTSSSESLKKVVDLVKAGQ